jgi:hypothetical protein
MPVAVKGGGVAAVVGVTVVVVGALTTFLGVEVQPLRARALARTADTPTKTAGRDDGRKT